MVAVSWTGPEGQSGLPLLHKKEPLDLAVPAVRQETEFNFAVEALISDLWTWLCVLTGRLSCVATAQVVTWSAIQRSVGKTTLV